MELVLNTFGASLGREQEGFIVSTNEGKQRIPTLLIPFRLAEERKSPAMPLCSPLKESQL